MNHVSASEFFSSKWVQVFIIVAVGLVSYSNTLDVPLQWDELEYLQNNHIIRNLENFLDTSEIESDQYYDAVMRRYVGYLTFALNYELHGFSVRGYHVFNLAVHLLNGIVVYLFIACLFQTPFFRQASWDNRGAYVPLFVSLLFVAHPVQTEAVTYVFQRFASLVSLFYIFSLFTFIKWRLRVENSHRFEARVIAYYALSITAAVLAMKTKENAFTLPVSLLIVEFLFFDNGKTALKTRLIRLAPFMLTLMIVPSSYFSGGAKTHGGVIEALGAASRGVKDISRMDYFLTQYRVVVTYIRLLLFPVDQNVNYHYPVYDSLLTPQVFFSFMLFLSLVGLGVILIVLSKRGMPLLRLAGFGIIWFFLTLSVESTLIPLPMIITEYRLYLPSVGAFVAITVALLNINRLPVGRILAKGVHILIGKEALFGWTPFRASLSGRTVLKKGIEYSCTRKLSVVLSSAVIIAGLIAVTYQRNSVWHSRVNLWRDVVEKSPLAARGHNNLAIAYRQRGMINNAIEHFEIAATLKPDNPDIQYNLAQSYLAKGLSDKATEHYKKSLNIAPDQEKIHNNLGIMYFEKGLTDKAIQHFQMALRIKPDLLPSHLNLALAYLEKGMTEEAEDHLQTVLSLDPRMEKAHFNLGVIYLKKGNLDKAHEMFHRALALAPDYVGARRMHDDLHRRLAYKEDDL